MLLTIEKPAFAKALARVSGIVEKKNTIPILGNLLLRVDAGALTITGTDMDMEAQTSAPVISATPGLCTVPAAVLGDIVKRLPDGCQIELQLDAAKDILTLRAGRSRFQLPTQPPADFPTFSQGVFSHGFEIAGEALLGLIDSTRFAVSTEETRYYLNGIYLNAVKGADGPMLRSVATDGHRLALASVLLPEGGDGMPGVIVPRKAVAEIRKLLDGAGPVQIDLSETKLRISAGGTVISTKLIDGTFPDYARVIPDGNKLTLEIAASELAAAADRVATIGSEGHAIKLTLEGGNCNLSAHDSNGGSSSEDMECGWTGPALEIGFNGRYLTDIIQAAGADCLRLRLLDAGSPCLISDTTQNEADRCFVLMPMRA